MRKEEKFILNGILIVGGTVALIDIVMQWLEHREKGSCLTWQQYNGWRTLKRAALGGIIGAGAGRIMYEYALSEEAKIPFNSDSYLKKTLQNEHLRSDSLAYRKALRMQRQLIEWAAFKFKDKLVSQPESTGSFYKGTAIKTNFDLDIILPFKRNSYGSLEEMYYDVYEKINSEFGETASVFKQTKAVGISFDNEKFPIHFDIVPGREINNYKYDKDLNLFVRANWIISKSSSFKTNTNIQKHFVINQLRIKELITLLKIYKTRNNFVLPPLIIEECIQAAISDKNLNINGSITNSLLNCMSYLSLKLAQNTLIDPANSNNNLFNKLTEYERHSMSDQLCKDYERIKGDPRYLREIFA